MGRLPVLVPGDLLRGRTVVFLLAVIAGVWSRRMPAVRRLVSFHSPQAMGVWGQVHGSALGGQGVEEKVLAARGSLSGVAGDAGGGGVHDERGQVVVTGELVQVPGGVGFGAEDGRVSMRCGVSDSMTPCVEDGCGVDDGGQ